jgi:pimeloyl-ACP methyl ester carboxylesterase
MTKLNEPGRGPAGELRSITASDGVKLQYEVVGAGPPLVLLHGGFAGRFTFSRQKTLAERYLLIIPSSRGHDGTDSTLPVEYGFDSSEVADLCAVLDAETIEQAHFIAHSSGGATAFAFARRYPNRVKRLILIEPTLLALLPPAIHRETVRAFEDVVRIAQREGDAAALRAAIAWSGGEAWSRLDDATQQARLQSMAPLAPITGPHAGGLLAFRVTDDDVRSLRPRTLLLYGTNSFDFEPAIAQRFRELRPDLLLMTIDGAGHNLHRERPDIVNPAIADFLAS